MKELLKERMNKVLDELVDIIETIQIKNLLNEQFTLNFLDEVNKLSISY